MKIQDMHNKVDNLIPDTTTATFIKSQPYIFVEQFLFYYVDVGHSVDKSINRAMSETFEIYQMIIHETGNALDDCNLTDAEKVDVAKQYLNY